MPWRTVFQKTSIGIYGKVKSKSRVNSQCMDDVTGNENITQLFTHKYDVLYNSVCSNSDEMSNLLNINQADIKCVCLQLDTDSHKND